MCACASIIAGMIVLPVTSSRVAAAGMAVVRLGAGRGDPSAVDHQRGALDGRRAVTGDEARAVERDDA